MAKWIVHTLLVAMAYVIAGRFGQYLAAPPIYASAVWPASGIAFAGILLLGYRVWPGLLLGTLAVNSWSPLLDIARRADIDVSAALLLTFTPDVWLDADNVNIAASARKELLVASCISLGATLQAIVAAVLVRRFVGFPSALNRERDILLFLGIGGPGTCVISASVGISALVFAGKINSSNAAFEWWTWWVGDTIGVIISAPLILVCLAQPRNVWRPRVLSVALPLCVTLVVVAVAFTYAHLAEQKRSQLEFERRAGYVFQDMNEHIDRYVNVVHSMQSFYASSVGVTRDEFERFNRRQLSRHEGIQALEWLPRVTKEQRDTYESEAHEAGDPTFRITERDSQGNMIRAADRPEYYPVYFVVPRENNEAAVGYDLASDDARRAALETARDTGEPVATAPIRLVQETGDATGFLVILPIYANDATTETTEERREHLRGYVLGVFRVGDMIRATLPVKDSRYFNLEIADILTDSNHQALYDSGNRTADPKTREVLPVLAEQIRWSSNLPVADRVWRFDFRPSDEFYSAETNRDTWLVLAGGLAFASLLCLFLMIMSGRATQVEDLVVERTQELSDANRDLEGEIASRKKFEVALSAAHDLLEHRVEERTADLKASEARFQDLYDNAPDMFMSVDVATRKLIECNQTFLDVTGYDKNEILGREVFDIYDPDCLDAARAAFERFLATGNVKDVELTLLRKHGDPLPVSLNVSAVRDAEGKLTHSRSVLRDIHEKKLAEESIKRHEAELAHVARLSTMGEMAAGLAHEINQPLAAITAYADGVAMRLRDGTIFDEQLSTIVGHISADAHRAGEVIRRLRRFVRNREPDRAPVEINSLILDVAQFVAGDATQRQVQIQLDLDETLPPAMSDPIEFQQVLLNLVRNGFDAMEDNNEDDRVLSIRTRVVDLAIEIRVEDCGHGLPGSASEQVFEAFFTSKEDGLGMGLAISRSIVESHGGKIWASDSERGASFHFTLPIAPEGALHPE